MGPESPKGIFAPKEDGHPAPTYRPDIDGLRCVAVLSVVLFHTFPAQLPGGFVGVDIFFVISGFLITGILMREAEENRFSILRFYSRRIRRIFPALALTLVAALTAGWFLLVAAPYAHLGKHVAGGAGFIANVLSWREASYFDLASSAKPLLHLWSLGVEEQFYIVWPVFIYLLAKGKIDALRALAATTALSLGYCLYLTLNDPGAAFYSPLSRCWQLSLGGLVAALVSRGIKPPMPHLLSLAGAASIAAGLVLITPESLIPGLWAVLPVSGTAALIFAGREALGNRLLSVRPAVWVGLISYPLYLWHWPLLSFALIENYLVTPRWPVRLGLMLIATAAAFLTYRFVEKPLKRAHPIALLAAMGVILGAGVTIYTRNGLPQRAVNSEPRKVLVAGYRDLRRNGLYRAYREECDFVAWDSLAVRDSIPDSCTAPGARGTYFLWGDSHAQALSFGLRLQLPANYTLAQVATSACAPAIPPRRRVLELNGPMQRGCRRSNEYALAAIRRLKPELVFLAQSHSHQTRDWESFARSLLAAGAQRVILIGPVPQWRPSLPAIVARGWPLLPERAAQGLDWTIVETDAHMRKERFRNLTYVSLIGALCQSDGCLAKAGQSLLAVDHAHLSPAGSIIVGDIIFAKSLKSSPRSAAGRSYPVDRATNN